MSETVLFDPGIGQFVIDFNNYINDVYSHLMTLNSIAQKRIKFKLFNSKIYSGIQNNIAFFLGCLLWAYYIKKTNINSPKLISGNVFSSLTEEQIQNYDFLIQINFIENYFDSYERDTLYYTGKKVNIPDSWKNILNLYKEFISLNKGFVKVITTDDILLPEKLDNKTFDCDIKQLIDETINTCDLTNLFKVEL